MAQASAFAMLIGGCTGAKISNVTATNAAGPAPFEVLVDVSATSRAGKEQLKINKEVAVKLQQALIKRLLEARVTAESFVPGTRHPNAILLRVSITEADPGDAITRFIIGFGAGRAKLEAQAQLESSDDASAHSMTAFQTSGNSGHKPGLIMPGGVAIATGQIIHLAIGGVVRVATGSLNGLDKPVSETAKAIVGQLRKYYRSVGWHWPGGSSDWLWRFDCRLCEAID
ncbi:MAG TPA: DUF4410 domain-containing protein [Bradyrhizobium sp.]|nr:DUF4410 domain-containing protein [Bradyrhizobium sp.]